MGRQGFAKLWRSAENNWLYTDEPFDRWHAFQDLWAMKASWKKSEVFYQNTLIKLERGQLATSISQLAREWKWSRGKVRRFLKTVQQADMIRTENGQGYILITICNYDTYQDVPEQADSERTGDDTANGQEADRGRTPIKNTKKVKKERRKKKSGVSGEEVSKEKREEEGNEILRRLFGCYCQVNNNRPLTKEKGTFEEFENALRKGHSEKELFDAIRNNPGVRAWQVVNAIPPPEEKSGADRWYEKQLAKKAKEGKDNGTA